MSKLSFTKLGLTENKTVKLIPITTKNGEEIIEVKQYLPYQTKMEIMGNVINNCRDENGYNFHNLGKVKFYTDLNVIYYYTNLTFTEKQKEDEGKLYDLLLGNGIIDKILAVIPEYEKNILYNITEQQLQTIEKYANSARAIVKALTAEEENANPEILKQLQDQIKDPESLTLIKEILNKLD